MLTKEQIIAKRDSLEALREKHMAQVYSLGGAIQCCNDLLKLFEEEKPDDSDGVSAEDS